MTDTTIDPVCGMVVDPDKSMSQEHDGRTYYFCESACAETFDDEPERWVVLPGDLEAASTAAVAHAH